LFVLFVLLANFGLRCSSVGLYDASCVDLPCLLIKPVIKILVHFLTIVLFPGLGQVLIVKVKVKNLRDL